MVINLKLNWKYEYVQKLAHTDTLNNIQFLHDCVIYIEIYLLIINV